MCIVPEEQAEPAAGEKRLRPNILSGDAVNFSNRPNEINSSQLLLFSPVKVEPHNFFI